MTKKLKDQLEKYKKIKPPKDSLRKELSLEIEKQTGETVSPKNIKIIKNTARIKTNPILKSEIQIKQKNILKKLTNKNYNLKKII